MCSAVVFKKSVWIALERKTTLQFCVVSVEIPSRVCVCELCFRPATYNTSVIVVLGQAQRAVVPAEEPKLVAAGGGRRWGQEWNRAQPRGQSAGLLVSAMEGSHLWADPVLFQRPRRRRWSGGGPGTQPSPCQPPCRWAEAGLPGPSWPRCHAGLSLLPHTSIRTPDPQRH